MSIEIIKTDSELITVLKLKISARVPFYRVDRDPGDPPIHPGLFFGSKDREVRPENTKLPGRCEKPAIESTDFTKWLKLGGLDTSANKIFN